MCLNFAETQMKINFAETHQNTIYCGFIPTSKTPYVAIDERGLVRSIHLFLFSCVH